MSKLSGYKRVVIVFGMESVISSSVHVGWAENIRIRDFICTRRKKRQSVSTLWSARLRVDVYDFAYY